MWGGQGYKDCEENFIRKDHRWGFDWSSIQPTPQLAFLFRWPENLPSLHQLRSWQLECHQNEWMAPVLLQQLNGVCYVHLLALRRHQTFGAGHHRVASLHKLVVGEIIIPTAVCRRQENQSLRVLVDHLVSGWLHQWWQVFCGYLHFVFQVLDGRR